MKGKNYWNSFFRVKPHGLFIGVIVQLQYNSTAKVKGIYVENLNIDIKLKGIEVRKLLI